MGKIFFLFDDVFQFGVSLVFYYWLFVSLLIHFFTLIIWYFNQGEIVLAQKSTDDINK